MAFLEKTAWAMATVLTLVGAFYAWEVIGAWIALDAAPPPSIKLAVVYVILVIIGSVISMSVLGGTTPRGANAPADEREQVIVDRAGHWSGYVLALGAIVGVLHFYVFRDGNLLFHAVIAGLMLSQIAEYVFQIVQFRRG